MAKTVLEERPPWMFLEKIVNFTQLQYPRMYFLVTFGTHRGPILLLTLLVRAGGYGICLPEAKPHILFFSCGEVRVFAARTKGYRTVSVQARGYSCFQLRAKAHGAFCLKPKSPKQSWRCHGGFGLKTPRGNSSQSSWGFIGSSQRVPGKVYDVTGALA